MGRIQYREVLGTEHTKRRQLELWVQRMLFLSWEKWAQWDLLLRALPSLSHTSGHLAGDQEGTDVRHA